MTLDDPYLRRLDSLARFYNSQITAHVGYEISVTVGLLALLSGFFAVTVQLRHDIAGMIGGMLDKHIPSWIVVVSILVLCIFCLVLYFLLSGPFFVFRQLLGATQYYQEMSYIVFEHMGLNSRYVDDLVFETLRNRALLRDRKRWKDEDEQKEDGRTRRGMEGGIEEAVVSLLEARLFVSKCQEIRDKKGDEGLQRTLQCLAQKVLAGKKMKKKDLGEFLEKVFDVTAEEGKVIIRDEKNQRWYDKAILLPTWTGYRTNTLLFLADRIPSSTDRGASLKCVFDC